MPDPNDENCKLVVLDVIDYPVVSHAKRIVPFRAFEFLYSSRAGLYGKGRNPSDDSVALGRRNRFKITITGGIN
jgi:hypothetical protein